MSVSTTIHPPTGPRADSVADVARPAANAAHRRLPFGATAAGAEPAQDLRATIEAGVSASRAHPSAQGERAHTGAAVVIATINRPQGDTGVHTHTRALADGLRAAGVSCDVVSPFSAGPQWLPIFALRRTIKPLNRTWSTRWYRHWHGAALHKNLIRRFASHPPAAVVAQCPVSADAALAARERSGLKFPVAMVCHFNFSEATEYREKGELADRKTFDAMLALEQRVLTTVDRVIYVSRWARDVVERARDIAPRSSAVVWNGIAASVAAKPISRADLGLRDDDIVLINVGTLEPRKNQVGLIDLFAHAARRHRRARLVLVGEGPQRAEVERAIVERGLSPKVTLLGLRRDVPALLATADVYVHAAALENCPVVLLEAARAGLPVAAATGGGSAELLEVLGGAALNADPKVAAADLDTLLEDATLRRQVGDAARRAFEATFTREAMVEAYLNALDLPGVARDGDPA